MANKDANKEPQAAPAVGAQVHLPVRPCAWADLTQDEGGYITTDAERCHDGLVPLYDAVTLWNACARAGEVERERCAKLVEAMDTTGHDGYIETSGDLCEAIAARIRRT